MNHVVVGDFGNDEVLLLAYDDGDVLAYGTRQFADLISNAGRGRDRRRHPRSWLEHDEEDQEIEEEENDEKEKGAEKVGRNQNNNNGGGSSGGPTSAAAAYRRGCGRLAPRRPCPRPFFHENVGASAWGLALHRTSRLIAVGSNNHEITVFAPALERLAPTTSQTNEILSPSEMEDADAGERALWKRRRGANARVVLGGTITGMNNLPSVAFIDNEDGEAEMVMGLDVEGQLWIFDIWAKAIPSYCIPNYRGKKM